MSAVIRARDLVIEYATDRGPIRALDGADLAVEAGESVGIVGESGSGKTTLGLAIGRLLAPNARVLSGDLAVLDAPVLQLDRGPHVAGRRSGAVPAHPFSRHAQMRCETLVSIEPEQHPLSRSPDLLQPMTGELAILLICSAMPSMRF